MHEKPLTVFTYAASASLAAIALVYFFHPNYLLDNDSMPSSAKDRKKAIVGLSNAANDCFINCVLQSLSGLGDLRIYLIREIHRRGIGGEEVYGVVPEKDDRGSAINAAKLLSLQHGEVSKGLKEIIDKLNERPLYRKTISAAPFIRVLESAFRTNISRAQQDAQELLQLVAERLSEEYHAGRIARHRYRLSRRVSPTHDQAHLKGRDDEVLDTTSLDEEMKITEDEEGFPLEGRTVSQVECEFCHFVPKATPTSFVMLNLMVPQKSASTLNECFDAHFKTEYIDDYKCDKCRLVHAITLKQQEAARKGKDDPDRSQLEREIALLDEAIKHHPDEPPVGVKLADIKLAPKRKIARHIKIVDFPRILVIHLSRSIYDSYSSSKNTAKVSFPERLPVGGLVNRRMYKLLGVVTHKGTHNSGHYETFRRQHAYAPLSNPHLDLASSPFAIITASPHTDASNPGTTRNSGEDITMESATASHASKENGPREDLQHGQPNAGQQPRGEHKESVSSGTHRTSTTHGVDISRLKRRRKFGVPDRWWRISDDKIRECKLEDVLGMTREVYMLFFEIER